MPQIADVSLTDSASTKVYKPQGVASGVASYAATAASPFQVGQPTLSLSVVLPSKASTVRKVRMKLVLPTVTTSIDSDGNPTTTLLRSCQFDGTLFLPVTSAEDERDRLLAQVRDLLGEGLIESLVSDLETIY